MGLLIFLAIYTFFLLAFVPAKKLNQAQEWCQKQLKKIKDKLNN